MIAKFLALFCVLPCLADAARPVAAVLPVVTDYYGTKVTDNYRWMETPGSRPLAAFMAGQNKNTRAQLDAIPGRAALLREITAATAAAALTDDLLVAGGKYFYTQRPAGGNTAKLYMRDAATGVVTLLVDPDRFSKSGGATAINFFAPSQDGKYVAYGVSAGGSEADTLRVLATADLRDQAVAIDRVDGDNDEFLPAWWLADDTLLYYRQQQLAPGADPAGFFLKSQVFLHHLGANPNGGGDQPVFGYGVDPAAPAAADQDALVMSFPGCGYAFGVLTENESSDVIDAIYITPVAALAAGKPSWQKIAGPDDHITAFDAAGNRLFLLTYKDAPRSKIISTDLTKPNLAQAATVVAQSAAVITGMAVAKDALYVNSAANGFSQITRLPLTGGPPAAVALPYPGTVDTLAASEVANGVVFALESWTKAPLWFASTGGPPTDTGIEPKFTTPQQIISREVTATSYDGTQVPLSIIMPAGTRLDGKNPTLLVGYGSYGLELTPYFAHSYLPWFAHGGIIAVSHVRGGSWYGEDWHQAGMKLHKINTIFDFIACAQYLEDQHYTGPKFLAGEGGSAGGITIGGAINWRPDLFAAAIDSHGETDTLRSEFTPNGPPNIVEFGTVSNEAGFHGLYEMSAYANVRDGEAYPAVLLQTGANDPRVAPWEVAKMAARLGAASSSGKPILLSVAYDSGHGIGDTRAQDNADWADETSFILWQTGAEGFQPKQ